MKNPALFALILGLLAALPATPATQGNWYIRPIATWEETGIVDKWNVFGELSDSVDGYDSHDLAEMPPFGDLWFTIVFPHLDWPEPHDADYASDYRALSPPETEKHWRFEVRSSDPTATIVLTWEGPDPQVMGSTLTDEETGQKVKIEPGGSFTVTMTGPVRGFKWSVQEIAPPRLIYADGFETGVITWPSSTP